jgi:ribosome-binding protein aMBF1 (putative translation factor)
MKTIKARKYNSKTLADILADIPKSVEKQVSSTMAIAALIDDEMKKNNLSIDDVAKIFKVKPETIGHWLSGSFDFKISTLCKIEEKIGIELFKITEYKRAIKNESSTS